MSSVTLVVGASGGIGGACVRRLAAADTTVLAASRREPDDATLSYPNVSWCPCDITSAPSRASLAEALESTKLPLKVLVIASGVAHRGPVTTNTGADWDRLLAVNLVGPALLISSLVGTARWASPASIVVVGSLSARRALPDRSLYGATKAALEHHARCIAVELAKEQILVNVVSPGVTATPFLEGDEPRLERYTRERVPTGVMATSEEVAEVVFGLAQGVGSLVGATINVDGGTGVLG